MFYASVALVTAGSVAFGLDWVSAPMQPMLETEASVQAAKLAANIPSPRPYKAAAEVRSVYPARPLPQTADARPTTMGEPVIGVQPPPVAAAPAAAAQPKCDIAACSAAYHSFRAIDCTWQPFDGPRRFCDKGQPPQTEASAVPGAGASIVAPEPNGEQTAAKCNVEACRQAYFTFNPADCTYQPSEGPRRLCEKGTPPKPAQTSVDPAVAAANAANAANATKADAAAKTDGSAPKCNVDACKQAFFTFNPVDCTYQPSDGPRRLCTK